jgi:hypothetical protein
MPFYLEFKSNKAQSMVWVCSPRISSKQAKEYGVGKNCKMHYLFKITTKLRKTRPILSNSSRKLKTRVNLPGL